MDALLPGTSWWLQTNQTTLAELLGNSGGRGEAVGCVFHRRAAMVALGEAGQRAATMGGRKRRLGLVQGFGGVFIGRGDPSDGRQRGRSSF